ncbi:MAG TPA: hypothetical protein VF954_05275 [Acidimicrobiales bacterium]
MPSPADRDLGLRRLARATRWVAAGSVALTGLLAGVAAQAFAGHPAAATTSAGTSSSANATTTTTTGTGLASSSSADDGLQQPASVPQATTRRGRVTSGGS